MKKVDQHLKSLGMTNKQEREKVITNYQKVIEQKIVYMDNLETAKQIIELNNKNISANQWLKEIKFEKRLKEIDNFLNFEKINEKFERERLISTYYRVIQKVGYYFDEPRMAHMMIEMDEADVSEKEWLTKLEKDRDIITKWQPKWNKFVETLSSHFPENISSYFEGTKLVFGYTVILGGVSKFYNYHLILKRENGEVIAVNIDSSGWRQVSVIDDTYNVFKDKRIFHCRFNVERDVERQFHDALESFGQITFCEEINNVCDQYTKERKNMSKEVIEAMEKKAAFFNSPLMRKIIENSVNGGK